MPGGVGRLQNDGSNTDRNSGELDRGWSEVGLPAVSDQHAARETSLLYGRRLHRHLGGVRDGADRGPDPPITSRDSASWW